MYVNISHITSQLLLLERSLNIIEMLDSQREAKCRVGYHHPYPTNATGIIVIKKKEKRKKSSSKIAKKTRRRFSGCYSLGIEK